MNFQLQTRAFEELGTALISLLVVSLLLCSVILLSYLTVLNQTHLAQARAAGLQAESLAAKNSIANLTTLLDSSESFPPSPDKAIFSRSKTRLATTTHLNLVTTAFSHNAQAENILLVSQKRSDRLAQPYWTALWQDYKETSSPCSRWKREDTWTGVNYFAPVSCSGLSAPIRKSQFMTGNVATDTILISGFREEVLRIAVLGSINIQQSLTISSVQNQTIEIIAVGDVDINDIEVDNSENSKLLIHSTLGEVRIYTPTQNLSLCETKSSAPLELTITSLKGSSLGETSHDPGQVGCPYTADPHYWPTFVVVGQR